MDTTKHDVDDAWEAYDKDVGAANAALADSGKALALEQQATDSYRLEIGVLKRELNALRNPWRDAENDPPTLEEFVLAIDSCGEFFLVQLFSDGSWMDEYDTLFLNMSYWMPIPAPNEVDAVSNPVNPNQVK